MTGLDPDGAANTRIEAVERMRVENSRLMMVQIQES